MPDYTDRIRLVLDKIPTDALDKLYERLDAVKGAGVLLAAEMASGTVTTAEFASVSKELAADQRALLQAIEELESQYNAVAAAQQAATQAALDQAQALAAQEQAILEAEAAADAEADAMDALAVQLNAATVAFDAFIEAQILADEAQREAAKVAAQAAAEQEALAAAYAQSFQGILEASTFDVIAIEAESATSATMDFATALGSIPLGKISLDSDEAAIALEKLARAEDEAARKANEDAAASQRMLESFSADRITSVEEMAAALAAVGSGAQTVGARMDQASRHIGRGSNWGMAVFAASQGLEDLQYGFHSVVNNIPMMVMAIGGFSPAAQMFAAGATVAAVSVNQLMEHWREIEGLWKEHTIESETEEMERLGKATHRTAEETARLTALKKAHHAEEEHQKNISERFNKGGERSRENELYKEASSEAFRLLSGHGVYQTFKDAFSEASPIPDDLLWQMSQRALNNNPELKHNPKALHARALDMEEKYRVRREERLSKMAMDAMNELGLGSKSSHQHLSRVLGTTQAGSRSRLLAILDEYDKEIEKSKKEQSRLTKIELEQQKEHLEKQARIAEETNKALDEKQKAAEKAAIDMKRGVQRETERQTLIESQAQAAQLAEEKLKKDQALAAERDLAGIGGVRHGAVQQAAGGISIALPGSGFGASPQIFMPSVGAGGGSGVGPIDELALAARNMFESDIRDVTAARSGKNRKLAKLRREAQAEISDEDTLLGIPLGEQDIHGAEFQSRIDERLLQKLDQQRAAQIAKMRKKRPKPRAKGSAKIKLPDHKIMSPQEAALFAKHFDANRGAILNQKLQAKGISPENASAASARAVTAVSQGLVDNVKRSQIQGLKADQAFVSALQQFNSEQQAINQTLVSLKQQVESLKRGSQVRQGTLLNMGR